MTSSMPKAERSLVDVHHHMIPPDYLDALRRAGVSSEGFPPWDPSRSLEMMDALGVRKSLLSLSSPGVWLGDNVGARNLARACNEYATALVGEHPERFGALAALPFPDLEGSLEESAYALDSLHLEGVILLSNVHGQYVGDPEFDALMAALDRRRALVLLHPNDVPAGEENAALHGWVEYPVDVARAYARLVFNDVLVRYPNIRWILAYAGGVVPFLAERLGKAYYVKGNRLRWWRIIKDLILKRNSGSELARRVSYDTAGSNDPVILTALQRLVEPGQIRFGSNFPWHSEAATAALLRHFNGGVGDGLQERESSDIRRCFPCPTPTMRS